MEKKNGNHTLAFVLLWFCISSCFATCWVLSNKIQEQNDNVVYLSRREGAISTYILTKNKSSVENALYDKGIRFEVISSLRMDGKFDLFVSQDGMYGAVFSSWKGKCIGTYDPHDSSIDLKEDCESNSNN